MAQANRPLSPHLQVYRWGAHMMASIMHRATGMALAVGSIILTWWLFALASGPEYFAVVQACLSSLFGRLVLFGITFALMQHLASGIRHLFMDAGKLYDLKINSLTARLTFVFSILATIGIWVAAYKILGGL
ncbi:succinate dehydrogenase, cytochrome b556 subunit [Kordiimonas sediminis]|uniref:Succinate dehydrogenase cytochrome b556 subunit n=1 Tax=Kordiimonas sediminis TaxID=1735581 RepID=A0A919ASI6_9PROT|nr:succinate dehydrogenase, cytochrome b556 subunit [Kordiimonas sediminis]GHF19872.1 succinate dehydrogenase, cytochrome b556 subunit [Kordiimonas sediminis]